MHQEISTFVGTATVYFTVPSLTADASQELGKNMSYKIFTSESVCAGHPDKICDRISDAIVDAAISGDPYSHVGVETLVTKERIVLAGEVKTNSKIDFKSIAKREVKALGYTDPALSFTQNSPIDCYIHAQSQEINRGVKKKGAGDQGMMFGYACKETKELMPLPITLAHSLAKRIDEVRIKNIIPHLRPDGKSQVTVRYENGKPAGIENIVLAVPHTEEIEREILKEELYKKVVIPILAKYNHTIKADKIVLNGTGVWHISGPVSDTGVTGRKIIVDTYGGYARVGGGAFSGKDPTKVDRSGAYAARYIAKNIVAHNLAEAAEVSLAYFIGAKKPVMQEVETFGTAKVSHKAIIDFMKKTLDTSVEGIIEGLDLRKPLYKKTSSYGHFGNPSYPWEKITMV